MKFPHLEKVAILSVKLYTALLSIILLPYLLNYLGSEQYGLIGSFVVIQACIQILDAGVSGVLTRQSIVTQVNYSSFRQFVSKTGYILFYFVFTSITLVFLGVNLSKVYATSWFVTNIDDEMLVTCVSIMFFVMGIRFLQGPFRSILLSFQKHKLLSLLDFLYATMGGPLTLFCLMEWEGAIVEYFYFQLGISVIVLLMTIFLAVFCTYRKLKSLKGNNTGDLEVINTSFTTLVGFGARLSILSMLWVIVNQSDKITLTKFMALSDYTYYSIAISIVGVLSIFTSTMVQIVRPRFTELFSENKFKEMSLLIKESIVSLVSILMPIIVFLIFFGGLLIEFWTSDSLVSESVMKYLPFILVGALFVSLSEFSFINLYAMGELRSHTNFYMAVSVCIVPLNVLIASKFLGEGASVLFMVTNFMIFCSWSMYHLMKYYEGVVKVLVISLIVPLVCGVLLSTLIVLLDFTSDVFYLLSVVIFGSVTVVLSFFTIKYILRNVELEYKGL